MSEPTEPDSAPDSEPTTEPATEPEAVVEDAGIEPAPPADAPPAGPKNLQLVYIVGALVVALAIGGGLFFIFRGDDDSKKPGGEKEAGAAAVATFEGIYMLGRGDLAGCQQMVDNLVLTPESGDFLSKCRSEIESGKSAAPDVTVDAILPVYVKLDDAAGTGTVVLAINTTQAGTSETNGTTVRVKKVDDHWKVVLNQ